VLVAAVAFAVAGCGGTRDASPAQTNATTATTTLRLGKTAYERRMRTLGSRLSRTINNLYPLASGSKGSDTAKQTALKLEKAQVVISDVYATMQATVPPRAVAKQHRDLEVGVRMMINQLGGLIDDARTGAIGAFIRNSYFTDSLQAINSAATAMTTRGYDVVGPETVISPGAG
jgi:hypothetical protein